MAEFRAFKGSVLKIYYFIGRLNPPHIGHIKALEKMIEAANADGSTPLILLGSGPGGERTMDNPVPFETKEQFLRHRLGGLSFTVRSMKNAYQDVPQWYSDVLTHVSPPGSVEFIRFAGDKGENATKFSSLEKGLEKLGPNVTAGTVAIPPVESNSAEEMSATIVRQHAYRCYLSDKGEGGFRGFEARFGHFYGEFSGQIYKDILFPVLELSDAEIASYIETKQLPKSGTKKSKSKK
jgi:hypothetical protein